LHPDDGGVPASSLPEERRVLFARSSYRVGIIPQTPLK
jgi:hypothetical protein